MEIVPLQSLQDNAQRARLALQLRAGALIAYPTDTLYGLGGVYGLPVVHQRIDHLKGRNSTPYSIAVANLAMLKELTAGLPSDFEAQWSTWLPGKYTLILQAKAGIAPQLDRQLKTIGVRIPAVPAILQLIRDLGAPLISTSVNRHGEMALNDPQSIAAAFSHIDILIDGGILAPSAGSTIIDLTTTPYTIIRQGDAAAPAFVTASSH